MTAKTAAIVLGIILVLFGLLGFINTPELGVFAASPGNDIVHIVAGIILLAGAFTSLGSGMALKIIGVIYAIVAIIGFFMVGADNMLLGFISMNDANKWLHVVIAIVILAAGFGLRDDEAMATKM
ncbi:MAG TPA: DUF4383 domain-containing protein [Bauldia sp.]|nr:DUF4383 domain-containing protein [Bauldia sp.]